MGCLHLTENDRTVNGRVSEAFADYSATGPGLC